MSPFRGNKSIKIVKNIKEFKPHPEIGFLVFLKRDEFDKVRKIIKSFSKEDTGIRDKCTTDFGTFYYTFLHKNKIDTELVLNMEYSMRLFKDLSEFFKNDIDKHLLFLQYVNSIRPRDQSLYDPYGYFKRASDEIEEEEIRRSLERHNMKEEEIREIIEKWREEQSKKGEISKILERHNLKQVEIIKILEKCK